MQEFTLCSMFRHSPNGKGMVYDPNEKKLWPQWNIPLWFIAPMEKACIYEILFYQVVIVMVKDKNRCTIKDTITGITLRDQE